jgi:hypothetical protein
LADDVVLPGDGLSVATDEVGGKHYQRVKVSLGAENQGTPMLVAGQQALTSAITAVLPSDMNPVESWLDDFSSTRWGITAMALNADNVTTFPLKADDSGALITTNPVTTAVTALCDARGRIAGPSITNSYATLLSMSGPAKHLAIWNSTDQELLITYDNGTTDNLDLDAGEFYAIDFMALGTRLATSTIKVKYVGAVAPKVGSVRAVMVR